LFSTMSSLLLRRYASAGDRTALWMRNANLLDLGTLPGDTSSSETIAINNAADVVGCSNGPRGMHTFLWSKAGGMQDLGVLPGEIVAELSILAISGPRPRGRRWR